LFIRPSGPCLFGPPGLVYSALRALFIRDAALSLVYLFIEIDDLMNLFIEKQAHCLPIKNPIVNRKSCNRQSSIDPSPLRGSVYLFMQIDDLLIRPSG
jgi:hypothetical protein